MMRHACSILFLAGCTVSAVLAQSSATPAPAPGSAGDLVKRGQELSRAGQQDQALALYQQALDKSPGLFQAHLESGIALDLKGDYAAAREHLNQAIEAGTSDSKLQAQRAMAISYVFAGDPFSAGESEKPVLESRLARNDSVGAAETCNELGRIYLEANDPDHAYKWYKMGYETVIHKPDLSEADKNLWIFRWESAQARIAARRGKGEEAQPHIVAAKAALDKANNPEQMRFYPYLTGYVAFYTGDFKTAISELQKADQHEPLNLVLLGQAYEKSGDAAQAKNYYRKVLEINSHSPTNAFARPLAKKKLEGGA